MREATMLDSEREAWLAERRTGITGTDIAAILGRHPWKTPSEVYADKLGLSRATPENEPMRWGKFLEPLVGQEYLRRHEQEIITIETPGLIRHPEHPWIIGTPDRIVTSRAGRQRILEIKTAGPRTWGRWGAGTEDASDEAVIQAMWYGLILQTDEPVEIAVLLCGQIYREYQIRRAAALDDVLIEAGRRFWEAHVLAHVPPPPDGLPAHDDLLKALHPRDDGRMLTDDVELGAICDHLQVERAAMRRCEGQVNLREQEIKTRLGDATGFIWENGRITWKTNKAGIRMFRIKFREEA